MLDCRICGATTTRFGNRCEAHYRCDDCGARDHLVYYVEGVYCNKCREKQMEKRIAEFGGRTEGTPNVQCPHCGCINTDSWELGDSDDAHACEDCENTFGYERIVDVTYTSWK